MPDNGGWTLVESRKGKSKKGVKRKSTHTPSSSDRPRTSATRSSVSTPSSTTEGEAPLDSHQFQQEVERNVEVIRALQERFRSSSFLKAMLAAMDRALVRVGMTREAVADLVCYGIGSFASGHRHLRQNSLYQLAVALCLRAVMSVPTVNGRGVLPLALFDPTTTPLECAIAVALGCDVLTKNEEGKRKVESDGGGLTLFYMPHCPLRLYSNLLWANWGAGLSSLLVFGNSFSSYHNRTSCAGAGDGSDNCVSLVMPLYREEVLDSKPVDDEASLPHIERAFNDLSWSCFPPLVVASAPLSLLENRPPEHIITGPLDELITGRAASPPPG